MDVAEAVSDDSYAARRALRAAHAGSDDDEDVTGPPADVEQPPAGPAVRPGERIDEEGNVGAEKTKKARPKLTYGHLTSQAGIPHVFGTFQEAFRKQRKGRGHEAHDLGCLLDMYERWAARLFPHCDFDTFISRVANLHGKPGGKATTGSTLKGDMRELRESVIQLALEHVEIDVPEGENAAGAANAAPAQDAAPREALPGTQWAAPDAWPPGDAVHSQACAPMCDVDDQFESRRFDEGSELRADPVAHTGAAPADGRGAEPAASSHGGAAAGSAAAPDVEDFDDEELMALREDGAAPEASRTAGDAAMEGMDDLMDEMLG